MLIFVDVFLLQPVVCGSFLPKAWYYDKQPATTQICYSNMLVERHLCNFSQHPTRCVFGPVKLLGCPNIFCRRSIQARKSWDKFFHQSHKPATKEVKTYLCPCALRSNQLIDALHLELKLLLTSCTGSPSHPSPQRSAQFGNPDLVSYPDLEPLPSYWVESSEAAPDP